jgi:hypothetical protein
MLGCRQAGMLTSRQAEEQKNIQADRLRISSITIYLFEK